MVYAIWRSIGVFRVEGKDFMAEFPDRPRHIAQRFLTLQADICGLARGHAFYQQLGLDECHRAHFTCDIQKMIPMGYVDFRQEVRNSRSGAAEPGVADNTS